MNDRSDQITSRRTARELALKCLFQESFSPAEPIENLLAQLSQVDPIGNASIEFIRHLVTGVHSHLDDIDQLIARHTQNWAPDRLALVDRWILRIGVFELKFDDQTPPIAVIDEAIEIARKFGGTDSPKFINGVLDSLLEPHQSRR